MDNFNRKLLNVRKKTSNAMQGKKNTIYKKKRTIIYSYIYSYAEALGIWKGFFFCLLLNDHLANEIRVLGFRLIMNRVGGEVDAYCLRMRCVCGFSPYNLKSAKKGFLIYTYAWYAYYMWIKVNNITKKCYVQFNTLMRRGTCDGTRRRHANTKQKWKLCDVCCSVVYAQLQQTNTIYTPLPH